MATAPVEIHLKNAKYGNIDDQATKLRQTYETYKALRKVTRKPGDLSIDYAIRSRGGDPVSGSKVTADRLCADSAKFRILEGIKNYVGSRFPDVASFDLAFDLACREIPDVILPEDVAIGETFSQ